MCVSHDFEMDAAFYYFCYFQSIFIGQLIHLLEKKHNYLVFDTVSNDRLTPVPQQKEDDLIPYIKTKTPEQAFRKILPVYEW